MTRDTAVSAAIQALGAVHLAVGLPYAAPGRVPLALAVAVGAACFWLVGRHVTGPHATAQPLQVRAAWGYALPLALCVAVHLVAAAPAEWDRAQAAAVALVVRAWAETPVAAYLLAAAYVLTRPDPPKDPDPFAKPR